MYVVFGTMQMLSDNIHLTSYNVHGLRDYAKRKDIISHFVYPKVGSHPDIVFFQETYSTLQVVRAWRGEFGCDIFCSHDSVNSGGILIAAKQELGLKVSKKVATKDFLLLDCQIRGKAYTLVNVYLRHTSTDQFIGQLRKLWQSVERCNNAKILIAGDFNAVVDANLDCAIAKDYRSSSSKVFQEFFEDSGLSDVFRAFHLNEKRFSYFHKHAQRPNASRLDYILTSDLLLNYTSSVDIGISYKSDHAPVLCTFYTNRNPPCRGAINKKGLLGPLVVDVVY